MAPAHFVDGKVAPVEGKAQLGIDGKISPELCAGVNYNRMCKMADSKIHAPYLIQAWQGIIAGAILSFGAQNANLVEAAVESSILTGLGNLIGGAVFPIGLIGIFLTGSNLFTGNCMYVIPPLLNGSVPKGRAAAFLCISFIANFFGALFVAGLLAYKAEYFDAPGAAHDFVVENAEKKINLNWGVAVLRGIGANFLVCLAWWQALGADDVISKIFAIWWPVSCFTMIGFEHSIANMFYVDIGLFESGMSFGKFLGRNLIPVTIGNIIGGSVCMGLAQWMAHDPNGLKKLAGVHSKGPTLEKQISNTDGTGAQVASNV